MSPIARTLRISAILPLAAVATLAACARRDDAPPAAAPAQGGRAEVERPNLILVTLDTTRADRLSLYGHAAARTPNLEAIGRRGVRFLRCAAPSAFTQPSHASILTGTYPTYHGLRVNGQAALADAHRTLAEQLAERGWRTGAFVGAFVLDGRWGLGQGFERYDDRFELGQSRQIDLAGVQRSAEQVTGAALDWLRSLRAAPPTEPASSPAPAGASGAPFFAWLHYYDPHAPYEPPPPFDAEFGGRGLDGLYDGEIAFVDAQLGRVLEWLERAGLDERTIVAVVGDHGEALGAHGELTHGYFLYDDTLRVPLLVRLPGDAHAGRVVAEQVRTIDLAPTLLELAGVETPPTVQGRSLLPLVEGRSGWSPVRAYAESMAPLLQYGWSPMFSLRDERWKYVDAPRPELYDLVADPGETDNRFERERAVASGLRRELERIHAESGAGAPRPEEANLDQETLGRLAALGYLGAAPTAERRHPLADPTLADPKDKLEIYGRIALAGDLVNREDHAAAARHLESVLALDAGVPQAKLLLATCYSETGRVEDARRLLDGLLRAAPDDLQALVAMANLLAREGREEDVLALGRRALAVDPRNTQAHVLVGQVYMGRGDHAGALPHLARAVEIQPKLFRNRLNLAACQVGLGRYDEAESALRAILEVHPRFPLAHFHLGLLHEARGRPVEARRAYLAEIEQAGESVPARFNLGELALDAGDAAGYREQMERVVELAPDRPKGYLFLARGLLAQGGELERARQLVDRGLALADTDDLRALGWFLRADIHAREGRPAEVEAALARARRFAAVAKGEEGT